MLAAIVAESNSVRPVDVPLSGPINFSANGRTYRISEITFIATKQFELAIKYAIPAGADEKATVADAKQLAAAYAAKYPELKDGFDGVVGIGIDPDGREIDGGVALKNK
jgi:hypothetical protein